MENLTKHQIVLLTLLVSFVTSIATGIVTVALMNQAPVGVTQTINRVVERTIQDVTTPSTSSDTPVVKETVVVSEDDQIVSAINKNTNSVLRIYQIFTDPNTGTSSSAFIALGAVVSNSGMIATDNNAILPDGNYFVKTSAGSDYPLTVLEASDNEQIALLQATSSLTGLSAIPLSSQGDLELGQAVVYIGGETKNIVATGIVSSLNTKTIAVDTNATSSSATSTSTQTVVDSVETSIASSNFTEGGLLLNLSGELVGIKSIYTNNESADLFAPASDIGKAIADYQASQNTQ